MLRNWLVIGMLSLSTHAAMGAIIEVSHPANNVIVKSEEGEQKLYVDTKEVTSSAFISVNRMLPNLDNSSDVYLLELSAGGSAVTPSYAFLTVVGGKAPLLSKEFGTGTINAIINDGKTITVKFNPAYSNVDNSVVQPAQTVIYKKGVVSIK